MGEKAVDALGNYLTEFGLDAGKDFLREKKEEKEIRKELLKYIENQNKYNELCTLAEEIDFEGIIEYLQGNFMEDVKKRLFGRKDERKAARSDIISNAVEYSAADTKEAKRKVAKFIADAVDILRHYYRETPGNGDLLLAAEIEDTVIEEVSRSENNIFLKMQDLENNMKAYIDKQDPYSIGFLMNSAQNGDIKTVEENLNVVLNAISCTHPLFPDYKYHFVPGKSGIEMTSMPTSNEAYQKYPPKIVSKATIKVGNQFVNRFDTDVVDYANRHQLTIAIDINEAKKLLGNAEDPIQREADQMVGKTAIIQPKPFPPALPYSIKINGETIFEYIELRTKEILDDGSYILTNEEQENIAIRISIKAHLISGQVKFDIRTENATNKELLQYVRFMKSACEKGKVSLHALFWGKDLMNGNFDDYVYDGGFATVDEEISFLENIILLEEYFHKEIKIPEDIYESDIDSIDYMIKLIRKERVELSWAGRVLIIPVMLEDDSIKEHIFDLDEKPQGITVYGDVKVNLFDEAYHMQIIRTFESAIIRDLEKVKKKAEVLEVGDTLRIKYIPESNDIVTDLLDVSQTEI